MGPETESAELAIDFGSTSGRQSVRISGLRPAEPDWTHWITSARFVSTHWRRPDDPAISEPFNDIVTDADIELPQLSLTRVGLTELVGALAQWETSLWPDAKPYQLDRIDLSRADQQLTFTEGTTDRIQQPWQKVLDISCTTGPVHIAVELLLDTTVLDNAIAQLNSLLRPND